MAFKISKGHMWRAQIEDKPGTFAQSLKPFAKAGHNLQIVAGYSQSKDHQTAAVEIFPVADEKGQVCAREAGLHEIKDIVCLIIEGEDRAGLAYDMAKAISDAGINLRYAVCQGVKQNFLACFGFQNDADAEKAKQVLSKL
jgi:hypothetical protein